MTAKTIADVTIAVVAALVLAPDLALAHALEAEEAEAVTVVTEVIVASTVVIWAIGPEIAQNPVPGKSLYFILIVAIAVDTSYILYSIGLVF